MTKRRATKLDWTEDATWRIGWSAQRRAKIWHFEAYGRPSAYHWDVKDDNGYCFAFGDCESFEEAEAAVMAAVSKRGWPIDAR